MSLLITLLVILFTIILFLLIGFKLGKEYTVQQGVHGETVKAFGSTWLVKATRLTEQKSEVRNDTNKRSKTKKASQKALRG